MTFHRINRKYNNLSYYSKLPAINLINNIKNINNNLDISKEEMHSIINMLLGQIDKQIIVIENFKSEVNYYNNNNNNTFTYQKYKNAIHDYIEKITELETRISDIKDEYQEQKHTCCVCLTEPANYANAICGHLCMCQECSDQINNQCPICRVQGPFIKIIKS